MSLRSIVIFCSDVYAVAPFWAAGLEMEPVPDDAVALAERSLDADESVLLRADGRPDVWVSPVESLTRPGNRLHLDLAGGPDLVDRLLALGGTHVRDQAEWTVLADPEGTELCVVPGRAAAD